MPPSTIYHLHPLLAGPLAGWDAELDRIAALGMRAVAMPPPFAPGRAGNPFQVADHDRPHPVLDAPGDGTDAVARIAAACDARGMALLLDLAPEQVAADGVLASAHPEWVRDTRFGLEAADPRRRPEEPGTARLDLGAEGPLGWWEQRLRAWGEAGVRGYRCVAPAAVPPAAWRRLIAAAEAARPGTDFIAWTAGLPRDSLPALAGLGFARTASSLAWWDFRAGWLAEEVAALRAVAPALAFPEAPFGERLLAGEDDPARRQRAALRLLRFAAGFGAGLLVPMGFEFGARRRADPARDRAGDWLILREAAPYDLSAEVRAAAALAERSAPLAGGDLRFLFGPGAPAVAVLRAAGGDPRTAPSGALLLANADLDAAATVRPSAALPEAGGLLNRFRDADGAVLDAGAPLPLEAGEARVLPAERGAPALRPKLNRPTAAQAVESARVAIESVEPLVDGGRFPVKRVVGEVVTVSADVFSDGHGKLGVSLLWRAVDERNWREARMAPLGNDRWQASFTLERLGRYQFAVEGWTDVFATYHDELGKKHAAGVPVAVELEEGRILVERAAGRASPAQAALLALGERLRDAGEAERLTALLAPDTVALMAAADDRPHRERQNPVGTVEAERTAARFAAWYEIFPRSQGPDARTHGTFRDVIPQLPRIRDMGFDVLYFTPIHPIGRKNRKGRNNTLTPGPDDPGSPYAIGAEEGGHDALHPELGTMEDFHALRDAAHAHGLELAMDIAIQCAPDHPWLRDHPDWFDWRPDGTIKYAENPPKKYQDIVNVDFYAQGAKPGLWIALRDMVQFWVDQGVKTFRVDNPHTKPLPFWEWMIADVRGRHPEAIFLSEAFTRPKVMYRLAKVGFSQSYTYFTWRNTKAEMQEYLQELNTTAPRDFFRPHFFVNTPDINPVFLQTSGRPGHLIRAALAATLSGLWGVYNGFELCEATPLPGKEEYLDSEKFELRHWDYDRPGNIVAAITRLNAARRDNPALHTHLGTTFYNAFSDDVLYFGKSTADRSNCVLAAISMNPNAPVSCNFELPLWEWGLPDDAALAVDDLMRGTSFELRGKTQHLRLDPADLPFALWRVRPAGA